MLASKTGRKKGLMLRHSLLFAQTPPGTTKWPPRPPLDTQKAPKFDQKWAPKRNKKAYKKWQGICNVCKMTCCLTSCFPMLSGPLVGAREAYRIFNKNWSHHISFMTKNVKKLNLLAIFGSFLFFVHPFAQMSASLKLAIPNFVSSVFYRGAAAPR